MTFALAFYETAEDFSEREGESAPAYWGAWSAYIDLLAEANVLVRGAGAGLQGPQLATTVRVREGRRLIQDGPLPDIKEQLGGFVLIDVNSLDEAMEWAAKAPCATGGGVEIRPIIPTP